MMHWRLGASKGPRAGTLRTGSDPAAAFTLQPTSELPSTSVKSPRVDECTATWLLPATWQQIPWARSGLEDLTRRCPRAHCSNSVCNPTSWPRSRPRGLESLGGVHEPTSKPHQVICTHTEG